MIANFADMIASFASDTLTRTRAVSGSTVDGFYVAGSTTSTAITAVVIRGVENQNLLPLGERTSESITIYTSADLQTTSAPGGTVADRLVYQGETYEVAGVRRWTSHGNYTEAVATKVGQ